MAVDKSNRPDVGPHFFWNMVGTITESRRNPPPKGYTAGHALRDAELKAKGAQTEAGTQPIIAQGPIVPADKTGINLGTTPVPVVVATANGAVISPVAAAKTAPTTPPASGRRRGRGKGGPTLEHV